MYDKLTDFEITSKDLSYLKPKELYNYRRFNFQTCPMCNSTKAYTYFIKDKNLYNVCKKCKQKYDIISILLNHKDKINEVIDYL